uniref:hypothetical protein n=1 Tax=Eubacterium cellulosolvens TaxID=29322 RepID=UPI0012DFAD12|nr:hypothetical protein [[Eubacterium] cellulosolvens]
MGIIDDLKTAFTDLRDAAKEQLGAQIKAAADSFGEKAEAGRETGGNRRNYPYWKKAWTGTIRTRTHGRK